MIIAGLLFLFASLFRLVSYLRNREWQRNHPKAMDAARTYFGPKAKATYFGYAEHQEIGQILQIIAAIMFAVSLALKHI